MKQNLTLAVLGAGVALSLASFTAAFTDVYANNGGFGDSFTNAGGTNTGQAVGASGWYYNNVRNNGIVGINTTYARNGNGSAYFNLSQGPGGASSKADMEYFASASAGGGGNYGPTTAIGSLGALNSLQYDWYRASGGDASGWLHPSIRLLVSNASGTESGYLVFEREVNNPDFGGSLATQPTDSWQTDDVFGGNYRMWATGSTLPNNLNGTNGTAQYYDAARIQDWVANHGDYFVIGVSVGVGSGWGTFEGAVDNVGFGFTGGQNYNFNFEVVPAPGALALLGLAGMANKSRRRRA